MNSTEHHIFTTVRELLAKQPDDSEQDQVEFLSGELELNSAQRELLELLFRAHPGYRLTRDRREILYSIGHKVGIDGKAHFQQEAIRRSEERINRAKQRGQA